MKSQGIPKPIVPRSEKITIGGKVIKIGPQTVPVTPGESQKEILEKLKEAGRRKLFPPLATNA